MKGRGGGAKEEEDRQKERKHIYRGHTGRNMVERVREREREKQIDIEGKWKERLNQEKV